MAVEHGDDVSHLATIPSACVYVLSSVVKSTRSAEHQFMKRLLSDLQGHPQAWAFNAPVKKEDVPDYYDVIKHPMGTSRSWFIFLFISLTPHCRVSFNADFSLMEHKLETSQYPTLDLFVADAQLVFDNCRKYNPEGSIYPKNATKLEKFMNEELIKHRKREE